MDKLTNESIKDLVCIDDTYDENLYKRLRGHNRTFDYHGEYMQSRSTLLEEQFGIPKEEILSEFGDYLNRNKKPYSIKGFDEFESIFRRNKRNDRIDNILSDIYG